jgi:hypothetical protein
MTSSRPCSVVLIGDEERYTQKEKVARFVLRFVMSKCGNHACLTFVRCRVARPFTSGGLTTTAIAEFENVLNMTNVVAATEAYGPNWLRPTTLQYGLNVSFGVQIRF